MKNKLVIIATVMILISSASLVSGLSISAPNMGDIHLKVGENKVFKITFGNSEPNDIQIMVRLDNSSQAVGMDNLDSVIDISPDSFTLPAGTEDQPSYTTVTLTFTARHSGVYAGDIVGVPELTGSGIKIARTVGASAKLTVERENTSSGGVPLPILITILLLVPPAPIYLVRQNKRKQKSPEGVTSSRHH